MATVDTPFVLSIATLIFLFCVSLGLLGMAFGRILQVLWRRGDERRCPAKLTRLSRWGMVREAVGDPVRLDWILVGGGLLIGLPVVFLTGLSSYAFVYLLKFYYGPLAFLGGVIVITVIFVTPTMLTHSKYKRLCQESTALSNLFPQPIDDVRIQRIVAVYRQMLLRRELREEFEFSIRNRRLTASEAVREFGNGVSPQRRWAWLTWVLQHAMASVIAALVLSIVSLVIIHMVGPSPLDNFIPGGRPD